MRPSRVTTADSIKLGILVDVAASVRVEQRAVLEHACRPAAPDSLESAGNRADDAGERIRALLAGGLQHAGRREDAEQHRDASRPARPTPGACPRTDRGPARSSENCCSTRMRSSTAPVIRPVSSRRPARAPSRPSSAARRRVPRARPPRAGRRRIPADGSESAPARRSTARRRDRPRDPRGRCSHGRTCIMRAPRSAARRSV